MLPTASPTFCKTSNFKAVSEGLPDKLGLAHFAEGDTLGKLGVFFLGQACLDYPVAVGRVVSFHGFQLLSFYALPSHQ